MEIIYQNMTTGEVVNGEHGTMDAHKAHKAAVQWLQRGDNVKVMRRINGEIKAVLMWEV